VTSVTPIIHVVDDDAEFRKAVSRLLTAGGYRVALYDSGLQFLEKLSIGPGCILLDLRMADLNGLELQDQLAKRKIELPVIFLSGHGDITSSVRAIKAGAEDFLQKPVAKTPLFAAIETALGRYESIHVQRERSSALRALISAFTPRENEVFALVVRGKLNKQIAFELGTSERTVKAHRHNLMLKLKVQSLAQAVSIAERLGLLTVLDYSGASSRQLDANGR
jgi:FixJ family two-component response regulator